MSMGKCLSLGVPSGYSGYHLGVSDGAVVAASKEGSTLSDVVKGATIGATVDGASQLIGGEVSKKFIGNSLKQLIKGEAAGGVAGTFSGIMTQSAINSTPGAIDYITNKVDEGVDGISNVVNSLEESMQKQIFKLPNDSEKK